MEAAGSVMSYIVLDRDILELKDLTLTEKVVLAYMYASEECEGKTQSPDFCAYYLDLSENEVKRAMKHIKELNLFEEEED